jgi:hypothetical protein
VRIWRAVFVLAGAGLVLVGLAVLALSVPALAVVGFDDTLDTGTQRFASDTAAIASAEASLGDEDLPDRKRTAEERWNLRLQAATAGRDGSGELFLGIGPAEEVDAWLDEVAWDKVTVFSADGTDVRYDRVGAAGAGDPSELPAPTDEDFWTVSDVGSDVTLDWDYREGHYTIVLMNADGSPGVDADGSLRLEIPRLSLFLVVLPVFGLGALLVGLVMLLLLWRSARRGRRAGGDAETETGTASDPTDADPAGADSAEAPATTEAAGAATKP